MAVTCAVTVANLYYAQPLLHAIGHSLHASPSAASLLVTAAQLGYAAGLLLVVPLGDIVRRRPLLTGLLAVDTLALAAGWRVVYGAAAVAMALTTIALRLALPGHGRELTVSYREQMRGVLAVARSEPVLRWRSLIGACGFAAFGCFWTTVTFLLAGPQYGFSQLGIGLFALVGAARGITAAFGRRWRDRRHELRWIASGAALAATAVSFLPIGLGGAHLGDWSLTLLIIGVLLMDAGDR